MDFAEYQEQSRKTAIYPNLGDNLPYLTLGITSEAGEVSDRVKKFIRDDGFTSIKNLNQDQKDGLASEVGDVLWYVSQIATELDISLEKIAEINIKKLHSRMDRDKLGGSGDYR